MVRSRGGFGILNSLTRKAGFQALLHHRCRRAGLTRSVKDRAYPLSLCVAPMPPRKKGGEKDASASSMQVFLRRLGKTFSISCVPSRRSEAAEKLQALWDGGPGKGASWTRASFHAAIEELRPYEWQSFQIQAWAIKLFAGFKKITCPKPEEKMREHMFSPYPI